MKVKKEKSGVYLKKPKMVEVATNKRVIAIMQLNVPHV